MTDQIDEDSMHYNADDSTHLRQSLHAIRDDMQSVVGTITEEITKLRVTMATVSMRAEQVIANERAVVEIRDSMEALKVSLAEIAATCPRCQVDIKGHDEAIKGTHGLNVRVESVERDVRWIWAVLGAAWTALSGMVFALLSGWFRNKQ